MKIAIIYSDRRGRYIAQSFRNFCDIVEIDLSKVSFSPIQKITSAIISFDLNRAVWVNSFYRNPLSVYYRKINGNSVIKDLDEKVDAVLQFGVMNTYDYSLIETDKVFYYHDGAYDVNSEIWKVKKFSNWFYNMQKNAFNKSTGIFTFSDWAKKQHLSDYYIEDSKVLNVGWGPCLPVNDDNIKIRERVNKIIFIGNQSKWKGLNLLLKVFNNIRGLYPNISLDVIGVDANDDLYINKDGVFFHGRQSEENVIKYIQAADLLVLPSLYERAGHVTIEAMWYGCPVIVSKTCGSPEPVFSGSCGIVISNSR